MEAKELGAFIAEIRKESRSRRRNSQNGCM